MGTLLSTPLARGGARGSKTQNMVRALLVTVCAVAAYQRRLNKQMQKRLRDAAAAAGEAADDDLYKHVTTGRLGMTFTSSGDVDKDFKEAKKKASSPTTHLELLYSLVWPSFLSGGNAGSGRGCAFLLLLLIAFQTRLMAQVASTHAALNSALHSRSGDFRGLLLQNVLLAFGQTLVKQTNVLATEFLALAWRTKLTRQLHADYFKALNYYHLVHAKNKLGDPDQRIANDVWQITTGMAQLFQSGLQAIFAGLYFTAELYPLLGAGYAAAPYLWVAFGMWWTEKIYPLDWRRLAGSMQFSFSVYRSGHNRLLQNAEAICALKGDAVEKDILNQKLEGTEGVQRRFWQAMFPFRTINMIAFIQGIKWLVPNMVMLPLLSGAPAASQAAVMATVAYRMQVFSQSMVSAGMAADAMKEVKRLSGNAVRVTKLIQTLEEMAVNEARGQAKSFESGDHIEFKNVQVNTPTGVKLVANLNFKLEQGGSLMITGHNGAGKSSIFRCLGGLWSIPEGGMIVKPGGAQSGGLHQDVFYLPQKPYNVLGTLLDQLTYPYTRKEKDEAEMTTEALGELLAQVDLEYLAARPGVLKEEVDWEEVLSLGEKQRLAMARLIYHKPLFAILDECTSAVSSDMELRLFRICKDLKISYITISHRPALRQFHDRILAIGDGKCGFSITDVPAAEREQKSQLKDSGFAPQVSAGTEDKILQLLERRSAQYKVLASKGGAKSTTAGGPVTSKGVIKKFIALMRVSRVTHWKFKAVRFLVAIALRTSIAQAWMLISGGMVARLLQRDRRGFFRYMGFGAVWVVVDAVIERYCFTLQCHLGTDIRMGLGRRLLGLYMRTQSYYRLKHLDQSITDPEQRLTDDSRTFALNASELFSDILKPGADMVWFTVTLRALVGPKVLAGLWAYMLVGIGLLKFCMPDYRVRVQAQQKLDGKFNFEHARVRICSESIAFFGGDKREQNLLNARYEQVAKLKVSTLQSEWGFNLLNNFFIERLPENLNFLAQEQALGAVAANAGGGGLSGKAGEAAASAQQNIFLGVERLFESTGKLLAFGPKIAQMAGYTNRIYGLMEEMEKIEVEMPRAVAEQNARAGEKQSNGAMYQNGHGEKKDEPASQPLVPVHAAHAEAAIRLANVDLVTPKGLCLARNLNFAVEPGRSLMVTGPNASGKSSLCRVLGGLWPLYATDGASQGGGSAASELLRPSPSDRFSFQGVFLVPQRIYMADGTLADQVTYPVRIPKADRTPEQEARMREQLEIAGIDYLVERNKDQGGWDAKVSWEDVLSLGEQQRMGMARMYYHTPKFAILDECTSAVSADAEQKMYNAAHAKGITCITISQRLALEEFHHAELRLGELTEDGWSLREIHHQ